MVLHIPSEEDIRNYESSHAALNNAWRRACNGRVSPAVIAFRKEKPGRLMKVEFVWTSEDATTEQRGIEELLQLSSSDGLVSAHDAYSDEYWIGVPANFQEEFSSSWTSDLKAVSEDEELGKVDASFTLPSRLHQVVEQYSKQLPADFPGVAKVLFSMAEYFGAVAESDARDNALHQALNILESCYRRNPKWYANELGKQLNKLAEVYLRRDDLKSALGIKGLLEQYRSCSDYKSDLDLNWQQFVDYFEAHSQFDEAMELINEQIEVLLREEGPSSRIAYYKQFAAKLFARHSLYPRSEALFEELLQMYLSKKLEITKYSYQDFDVYRRFLADEGRNSDLEHLKNRLSPLRRAATVELIPENSWGYVDRDGHWKIPPQFTWASAFQNGVARVQIPNVELDERDRGCYLIDTDGNVLGPDESDIYNVPLPEGYRYYQRFKDEFFEGLAAVVAPEAEAIKYGHGYPSNIGYAIQTGQIVIPPKFSYAEPFRNGIAKVAIGGSMDAIGCVIDIRRAKYGLINRAGDYLIKPEFESLKYLNEERTLLCFRRETSSGIIDREGNILCDIEGCCDLYALENGMISAEFENGKHGYLDASGNVVIPPEFDFAYSFSEELALVAIEWKWGYIDKSGAVVIPLQFEHAHSFENGIAIVGLITSDGEKYGCIDRTGRFVLPPIYDRISQYFHEGITSITVNSRVGLMNSSAQILCEPKYDEIDTFTDGLAQFTKHGNVGLLDSSGREVVPARFKAVRRFSEGLMAVAVWKPFSLKWGFIDSSMEFAVKPLFRSVEAFSDGLALVESENNQFGYIDKNGNFIVTPQYDWGDSFVDGFARVGKRIRNTLYCGVIDTRGNVIVPVEFEFVGPLSDGLRYVGKRCNWFRANR